MFDMAENEMSHYKGDSSSYFPLTFNPKTIYWEPIPVTIEKSKYLTGNHLFYSVNELTIDDNILTYDSRSTTFLNYVNKGFLRTIGYTTYWEGEEGVPDAIHFFSFQLV